MTDSVSKWRQIVVEDSNALSGCSVLAFVEYVCSVQKIKSVVVSDIIGAATGLRDGQKLPVDDFLERVGSAVQFDWAFFFLFSSDVPENFDLSRETCAIQLADVTIRLVDDQFFYVFTDKDELVCALLDKYRGAEVEKIDITSVTVPY